MASRARAGRLLGGIATVAGALVLLAPGQAWAAEPPTVSPAPAAPPAQPVPASTPAQPTRAPEPRPAPSAAPAPTRTPEAVPGGQVPRVPVGAADTGSTDTAAPDAPLLAAGALGLAGAAGLGGVALHRRRRDAAGR